jgi:dolichol-phosphate mannosyltransferase
MFERARSIIAEALPRPLALAVVIPTLNEADNVVPLLERLALTLADVEWEAIFVDDGSTDGTAEAIAAIAATDRRVRIIRRYGRRGLSSAVIEGMLASPAPVLAVIDADLQHDETILPALLAALHDGHDLAVGTRYAGGGSVGDWAEGRARASLFATRLAGLLGTRLSDPMSGFFAIRRQALMAALPRLSGMGYKILLDLVASSPVPLSTIEVPYRFRPRESGTSKLDSAVALEYALLLFDKLVGRYVPARFVMFLGVGALGVLVHLAILALLVDRLSFAAAQASAVIASMTFNFLLNNAFTYRDRRLSGLAKLRGLISFYLVCGVGAVANVGVGSMIYSNDHRWWLAGIGGAAIGSVWNYAASSTLTWRKP